MFRSKTRTEVIRQDMSECDVDEKMDSYRRRDESEKYGNGRLANCVGSRKRYRK